MMRKGKKSIISLFFSLTILGSVMLPMETLATQTSTTAAVVEAEIVYEPIGVNTFAQLFGVKAPEKEGYYFGGWYETDNETMAIQYVSRKNQIVEESQGEPDAVVYAKFVPAYMLNVKMQYANELNQYGEDYKDVIAEYDVNKDEDPKNNTKSRLRMISGVDSTGYKEVGFHVFVNGIRVNKTGTSKYNKTVYDKIIASGTTTTAKELFGMEGKLMIATFINIPYTAWGSSIYVRPYWITFDGIEVRGNGKYIHMEDGILGYMTIPVNVQGVADKSSDGVMAGEMNVCFDTEKMVLVDVKDSNCMLDTVMWDVDEENGNIKFVAIERNNGNVHNIIPNNYGALARVKDSTAESNQYENVNNMYATIRFRALAEPSKDGEGNSLGYRLGIENIKFCNSREEFISVNMWNVRY